MTSDDKTEMWTSLECVGASAYEVSDRGRVRSHKTRDAETGRPYLLRLARGSHGYLTVSLAFDDGRQKTAKVHNLVARAFLGPCPPGQIVRHVNDVSGDNRVENLAYGTRSENYRDALRNGAVTRGPRPHRWGRRGRLSVAQVRAMRRAHADGRRLCELARDYSLRQGYIRDVIVGRLYGWVEDSVADTARIKLAAETRLRRATEEHRAEHDMLEIVALERVAPRPGQRFRRSPHTPPSSPRSQTK